MYTEPIQSNTYIPPQALNIILTYRTDLPFPYTSQSVHNMVAYILQRALTKFPMYIHICHFLYSLKKLYKCYIYIYIYLFIFVSDIATETNINVIPILNQALRNDGNQIWYLCGDSDLALWLGRVRAHSFVMLPSILPDRPLLCST